MPRTPAPLTVEPIECDEIGAQWRVDSPNGFIWFESEADARAFVALPELIRLLKLPLAGQDMPLHEIVAALAAAGTERTDP